MKALRLWRIHLVNLQEVFFLLKANYYLLWNPTIIIKKQHVWDLFVVPLNWKKIILLFIYDFPEYNHTRGGKEGTV